MKPSLILLYLPLAACFPQYASPASPASPSVPNKPGCGGLTPKHFTWSPPQEGDVRSPCPMLNSLANHGFLPHDGRHITSDVFVKAATEAFNMDERSAAGAFQDGVGANPVPNATFIDLDMLHLHNFIEHDGSLSRRDSFFDPTNPFDEATFENLLSYFGDDELLNISATSKARARHAFDMSLINPEFTITEEALTPIMGENAMMLVIWGSPENPVANRTYYEFFFRNERLPVELGWLPPTTAVGPGVLEIIQELIDLTPSDVPLTYTPKSG